LFFCRSNFSQQMFLRQFWRVSQQQVSIRSNFTTTSNSDVPTIELDGPLKKQEKIVVPQLGFGTWKITGSQAQKSLCNALKAGYRHIDTAFVYQNEKALGQVLHAATSSVDSPVEKSTEKEQQQKKKEEESVFDPNTTLRSDLEVPKIQRNELFVTTKLWNTFHQKEHVLEACENSLRDLQLSYIDLFLIHWPVAFSYHPSETHTSQGKNMPVALTETWHAMQELVQQGLVRHIGVSNFSVAQLAELLRHPDTSITPAVNQIELHPFLTQKKLVSYCRKKGIAVTAYSPLGSAPSSESSESSESSSDASSSSDVSSSSDASSSDASSSSSSDTSNTVDDSTNDKDDKKSTKEPEQQHLRENPLIVEIAQKYDTTPAAVLLRWSIQHQNIVIPRSRNHSRIVENITAPFKFVLEKDELKAISKLNKDYRYVNPTWYEF